MDTKIKGSIELTLRSLGFKIVKHLVKCSFLAFSVTVLLLNVTLVHSHPLDPEEKVLYEENFDDGQAQGWNLQEGWVVDGGQLYGCGHYWAVYTAGRWEDYHVSLDLWMEQTSSINLNYRLTEGVSRYYIAFNEGGSKLFKQYWPNDPVGLPAKSNIVHQKHLEGSITYRGTYPYKIRIIGEGSRIRFFVDGVLEFEYTDPEPLLSGAIALETTSEECVSVDNIVVYGRIPEPTTPEPTTPEPTTPEPTTPEPTTPEPTICPPIDGCCWPIILIIVIAIVISIERITSGNGKGPERKKIITTPDWPREWLTEKRTAGFWVYPYIRTPHNNHHITIVIVKGVTADEKEEPILGETVNVTLFDEENNPLDLVKRPENGPLPEFGGPSISVNADFHFTVSAQPLKSMVVNIRGDAKTFDVKETTKARVREELLKKTTKWRRCVKTFSVPLDRSGRQLTSDYLYESFKMVARFDDGAPCRRRLCEYRQYVRGTYTIDGVAHIHQLPDGPLDPTIWCEDGVPHFFKKGHHWFYGHRDDPELPTDIYQTPDRPTGFEYRGFDSPAMSRKDPSTTLVMNLEFRGEIIDVYSRKVIQTTRWKVSHSQP